MLRIASTARWVMFFFLAGFFGGTAQANAVKPKVLCDFDRESLGSGWGILGQAKALRGTPPAAATAVDGPRGAAVRLVAEGPGGIMSKANAFSQDWRRVSEISLWIYRQPAAGAAKPVVLEVQFPEPDARVRFWQKIDVAHEGWKEYRLPLCWFLSTYGRVPQWSNVQTLRLALRGEGDIWLDNIGVIEGENEQESSLTPARLLPLAFPQATSDQLRTRETPHAFVASDASDLDIEALSSHLEKVAEAMQADIPMLKDAKARGILLVYNALPDYRGFMPRFAAQMQAQAGPLPAGSTGFTAHKVALSYWDPKLGSLRPVFMHEYIHSYVESALLIPCTNEWFQEGLANAYQLRFHPQKNIADMVRMAMADAKYQTPLKELCSGKRVPMHRYWQVATVTEMLLGSPKYRDSFCKLVAAFQQSASTNLDPQLKPVFGCDWRTFEEDWRTFTTTVLLERYSSAK